MVRGDAFRTDYVDETRRTVLVTFEGKSVSGTRRSCSLRIKYTVCHLRVTLTALVDTLINASTSRAVEVEVLRMSCIYSVGKCIS